MVPGLAAVLLLGCQGAKPRDVDLVDSVRVEQAIRKGVEYLKAVPAPPGPDGAEHSDELVLLAFVHAGLPAGDPAVQERLRSVLGGPLAKTYKVAVQAMALEELDRAKHQIRLWECAQFLVDNQNAAGQWAYGKPTTFPSPPAGTPTPGRATPSGEPGVIDFSAKPEKPRVLRRLVVKQQRTGDDSGDNSNSQYAALGLRACHEAGIDLPKEILERAAGWWRRSQAGEERDDDAPKPKRRPDVATGGAPRPLGWGYGGGGEEATGSMTVGATGALVIYDALLGKPWREDPDVAEGLAWVTKNFTVAKNPGGDEWHFYYLYGLERLGMLCEVERFGTHPWYSAGAKFILDAQKPDGSWSRRGEDEENAVWNTCFAILFLKRATRRVDVASVDPRSAPRRD